MQKIEFHEGPHKYFVDGAEYISVTTLVDLYVEPFRTHFWSKYKAVELIFKERHGDSKGIERFQELKQTRSLHSPGWFNWICGVERIEDDELEFVQRELIHKWDVENQESRDKGTAYHNAKEDEAYNTGSSMNHFTKRRHRTAHKKGNNFGTLTGLRPGYYPELKIWNNQYRVIGTADRVFVGPGTKKDPRLVVWIDDYKTNKEIKKLNPYQSMKYPLGRLGDCNYNHYRLQICLYAWMLEQWGYRVAGTSINHLGEIHRIRYSSAKQYVEIMLSHYAGHDIIQMPEVARYGFSDVHLMKV